MISSFGASDHLRSEANSREFTVVQEGVTGILDLKEVGSVLEAWEV